jgi:flagellar biosynthetic protein FlhB
VVEERTEQATPRRREEARQRGDVPRSAELAGAAALLGALIGLRLGWPAISDQSASSVLWFLRECRDWQPTIGATARVLHIAFGHSLRLALPVTVGAAVAGLAANLGQSAFVLSSHPVTLRWERLSLAQGLLRMFSRQGLFSLARSLAKLGIVAAVTGAFLHSRAEQVLGLAQAPAQAGALIWELLLRVGAAFAVLAVADYLYQRHQHEKRLRMTRHELREEHKRTEGDPLIRSRIRERQRALARHRMIHAVKRATVVITNPTEIAVALRYEAEKTPAPVVIAKGRRLLAERIRAEALKHGVPVTPSPDLARALYRSVPVGRQIPPDLYQAVAEILVFVYRLTAGATSR